MRHDMLHARARLGDMLARARCVHDRRMLCGRNALVRNCMRRVELAQGRDHGRRLLLDQHRGLGVRVHEMTSPCAVQMARKLVQVQVQHKPSSSRVSCECIWDRSCERERVAAAAAERRGLARGHGVATGEPDLRPGCAPLGPDRPHSRLDHLAEISARATPR